MRKLITGLAVIFYVASLLIVIAAFMGRVPGDFLADGMIFGEVAVKQPASDGEVSGKQVEMDMAQPESHAQMGDADDSTAASNERVARNEGGSAGVEQSGKVTEPVLLAILNLSILRPGQDVAHSDLLQVVLEHVPTILKAIPEHHVLIEGHTDSLPVRKSSDKKYTDNRELSLMRAETTASILEGEGVPSRSIVIKGYGDERPVASNASAEGRAKNRRVEMWLVPVDPASLKDE